MRILIFYQYFCTPQGSWSTRFYEFARRWVEEGYQVTVISAPYEKSDIKARKFIDRQNIEGIDLIIINTPDSNRVSIFKRALNSILFSLTASWFAITHKADIVIASSGPITIGIPGLASKFFRRKPFIFETRDLWPDGAIQLGLIKNRTLIKIAYYFEKLCYSKADLIVTCSKGMTDSIQNRFNLTNLITIPNASDYELFKVKDLHFRLPDWAVGKKIFIYTGSLGLMDNCIQIIKGIELIDKPLLVFVFIGEGTDRPYLERYILEKQIKGVHFIGLLPKTEVRSWLQNACAAFVTFKNIPILQTSSPNKLFDAFAASVPIIQTTTGWIKTLIENEHCGLNVSPDNPVEFAQAILSMADDDKTHGQLAINAERVAQTLFNRDILTNQYLDEIKSLVKLQ